MESPRIAAVVLAAGGSSRMGQPKQLVRLRDRPVLDYVLETVKRAKVDGRYVVLGHAANEVRASLDLSGFKQIENPDFSHGQSTSVVAAVRFVPSDVSATIFILGDQPLQELEIINRLADSYREHPAAIIQPRFRDGPGNPVLIDRSLFPALEQLTGDTGARPILKANPDLIRRLDCSRWARPVDVDTLEDLEQVRASQEEQGGANS